MSTLEFTGITSFKERVIDTDAPVEVYYNINKSASEGKPWYSLRQKGKVVAHADQLILVDASFHVDERGRQRVLAEKRKNVHAVIRGYIGDQTLLLGDQAQRVRYNPYTSDCFHIDGERVDTASHVACVGREVWAVRS